MITHLACIMDGNRRWAKKRLLPTWAGHKKGAEKAKEVIDFCLKKKIAYLSLYTFSLENMAGRSQEEKSYLFGDLAREIKSFVPEFIQKGIRLCFMGDATLFPAELATVFADAQEQTKRGTVLQCNILFCYGSRQEIRHAAQEYAKVYANSPQACSDELFHSLLWTGNIPDPDLIVRTGNVQRLSNFMLYQAAYAEIRFLSCMWPELSMQELEDMLYSCVMAQKNNGK